jgi:hypothetical protein
MYETDSNKDGTNKEAILNLSLLPLLRFHKNEDVQPDVRSKEKAFEGTVPELWFVRW